MKRFIRPLIPSGAALRGLRKEKAPSNQRVARVHLPKVAPRGTRLRGTRTARLYRLQLKHLVKKIVSTIQVCHSYRTLKFTTE